MIRFGIISFAHMHANSYARVLKEIEEQTGAASLVAIADSDSARLSRKATELSITNAYADFQNLLDNPDVDAVIIASENCHHAEQVVKSIEAGKHIICEKPLSVDRASIEKMRQSLNASSIKIAFQTAFVMRYDAASIEAKRKLSTHDYGAIKAISATNHGKFPGGWFVDPALSGGGAIMDHTVHAADLIRHLTEEEIIDVKAFSSKNIRADSAVEDNAIIYGRLSKCGAPVSIDCSWSRSDAFPIWGDLDIEILCANGVLKLSCFRPTLNVVSDNNFSWRVAGQDYNRALILDFCRALECGEQPTPDFEDGARAAYVALDAYESLR